MNIIKGPTIMYKPKNDTKMLNPSDHYKMDQL